MRLAIVAAAILLAGVPAHSEDSTYGGMYIVTEDVDKTLYLVEATTITTPRQGYRRATVYQAQANRVMGVYYGNIQSWEFRCDPLAHKLLADHDYQRFADGTWGDPNGPAADADFTPVTEELALGQVAKFACVWPKAPAGAANLPSPPADPKQRIQFIITHMPSG
jgi:hypothetical protein